MSEQPVDLWEERVRLTARNFPYPPTPDTARAVRARLGAAAPRRGRLRVAQLGRVALIVVLIAAGLMAVPPVRAAVLRVLRIGAVTIRVVESTPAAVAPTAAPTPPRATASPPPASIEPPPPSATGAEARAPTPTSFSPVPHLSGETTLREARARAGFPVRLPTYPRNLGPPDRVFLQDIGGPAVVLVWTRPRGPDHRRLMLYELGSGAVAEKVIGVEKDMALKEVADLQMTEVKGEQAVWITGPHLFQYVGGGQEQTRRVEDNVLIWTGGKVTYRLETDLPLKEARRIAESLR